MHIDILFLHMRLAKDKKWCTKTIHLIALPEKNADQF